MKKIFYSFIGVSVISLSLWASALPWTKVTGAASITALLAAPGAGYKIVIKSQIASAAAASSMYYFHGAAYPYTQVGPTMIIPAAGTLAITDEVLDIEFPANTAAQVYFSTLPGDWTYKYEVVSS
jgi:hypothetical protein